MRVNDPDVSGSTRRARWAVHPVAVALWLAMGWPRASESAPVEAANATDTVLEDIVVTATRSPGLIRNEPLRVEAVPAEEIEENLTVQPGNLSSLLHELPSIRVQSSAAGLGGAGLQLRGMPTRHTLVLADGLPSLGAVPDSFGLLQTPPLDLERVEVIKGAASALYGGSALGGVLNLVSRTAESESGLLGNLTSRGGRDLVGFFAYKDASPWSGTLTAGAHDQSREDVNGDGWADLPGFRRYTVRPRVWWDGLDGRSLFLTTGVVEEDRFGGTVTGRVLPAGSAFPEELHTQRLDAGAVSRVAFPSGTALTGRFSVTSTHLDRTFGADRVNSAQTTIFGEEALNGATHGHRWVLGLAFEYDRLAVPNDSGISHAYSVPAVFGQDNVALGPWVVAAGSVRVDASNEYGTFVSPRLSALVRQPGSAWSLRASVGGGYSAPTPLVDEIDAVGLSALLPLRGLRAERATTASLDARWLGGSWDVNASLFTSEIRDPIEALPATGNKLRLVNAAGPRRAPGAEALVGYVVGPLHAIASWSYIDATEIGATGLRQGVPLVPRQTVSLDGIFENAKWGRVGLEFDYTGRQAIADDPFRTVSRAYFSFNALAELRFNRTSVFLNAINLTNVRQTRFDPLIRPGPGPGGNPITDVWASLDGRIVNVGIRIEL